MTPRQRERRFRALAARLGRRQHVAGLAAQMAAQDAIREHRIACGEMTCAQMVRAIRRDVARAVAERP